MVKERAKIRLQAFEECQREIRSIHQVPQALPPMLPTSNDVTDQSEIQLLIEIISATHLPIADRTNKSTDPFVIVYLGNEEIHRTRHIPRTSNPVWTIDTGCLCLLSISAKDFFQPSAGLTFVVKDKDRIKVDDCLGVVSVHQKTLLELTGEERLALPLNILKAHRYYSKRNAFLQPTLHIRARQATKEDRIFMKKVFSVQKRKLSGIYADQTFVGPQRDRVNALRRESKIVDGVRKVRDGKRATRFFDYIFIFTFMT